MILIATGSAAVTIIVVLFLCWACTFTSSRLRARRKLTRTTTIGSDGSMNYDNNITNVNTATVSTLSSESSTGGITEMEQVVVAETERWYDPVGGWQNHHKNNHDSNNGKDGVEVGTGLGEADVTNEPAPIMTLPPIAEIYSTPRPSLDTTADVPDTPLSTLSEATIRAPRPLRSSLFSEVNQPQPHQHNHHRPLSTTSMLSTTSSQQPDRPTRRHSLAPSTATGSSSISALVAMYQTTLATTHGEKTSYMSASAISAPTNIRAVHPHDPVFSDEVEVRPGDQMLVEQVFPDAWAYGWNVRVGGRGMFPLTCLPPTSP
ncbi:hypothetical protein DFJ77DRAFT_442711 [Powellomyces hirtus]|nr:hypothetical protein DFJ77DRAFT_442711 [Powellomyces hirtus]